MVEETDMDKIDVGEKLDTISEHWQPRIVAELNGQHVKLAKIEGAFEWHSHADADELFYVVEGAFRMELRDKTVPLEKGQMMVVPRGIEHRPVADEECWIMMFEPVGTVNTGDNASERTVDAVWA